MEERGSNAGHIISLAFGIVYLIFGIVITGVAAFIIINATINHHLPPQENEKWLFIIIGVGCYISVLSVWVIFSANKMQHFQTLRNGYITCIILGILSLNIGAVIGALKALADYNKITKS